MHGKKCAAALCALLFFMGPAAPWPEAHAAPARDESAGKAPPRQKGGRPERLTYERAMELENKRHEDELEAIRRMYRNHPPKRRLATRKENERHASIVEKINRRFGVQ